MIDPAFSQLRVTQAFGVMQAAVAAYIEKLAHQAEAGTPFSLDFAMSELTADVICRTIFSTSLASGAAQECSPPLQFSSAQRPISSFPG